MLLSNMFIEFCGTMQARRERLEGEVTKALGDRKLCSKTTGWASERQVRENLKEVSECIERLQARHVSPLPFMLHWQLPDFARASSSSAMHSELTESSSEAFVHRCLWTNELPCGFSGRCGAGPLQCLCLHLFIVPVHRPEIQSLCAGTHVQFRVVCAPSWNAPRTWGVN